MAKSFTEESSQSEKKAKNLTSYIREFQSRDDFKKYLIISLLLLIVFETIVGLGFNKYFSETLEENKKKHYTRA